MAEQAINTVYALAERPDIFCDNLIKNLTRRVFGPKPAKVDQPAEAAAPAEDAEPMAVDEDAPGANTSQAEKSMSQDSAAEDKDVGDAFELSQLLFVVGHVAIKHIVFLELVEREWKRQKHEREQGMHVIPGSYTSANKFRS